MAARLTCANRIVDPLVEAVYGRGKAGMVAGLVQWSRKKRGDAATARAIGELSYKWMKKQWNAEQFLDGAGKDYTTVINSISSGQLGKVKPRATEGAYILIKRGIAEGIAKYGARMGSPIVQSILAPTIAQVRLVHLKPQMMRASEQRPDFVQVCVTHTTLQQPTATPVAREEKQSGGASSGYVSEGEAETAPKSVSSLNVGDAEGGEWMPVEDSLSGMVYWHNTSTGLTTWRVPTPTQLQPRQPFRIETAGSVREPLAAETAAAAGSPLPFMKVVHNVVWERSLHEGSPAIWRIAKL